jgi:hypothetical protein
MFKDLPRGMRIAACIGVLAAVAFLVLAALDSFLGSLPGLLTGGGFGSNLVGLVLPLAEVLASFVVFLSILIVGLEGRRHGKW